MAAVTEHNLDGYRRGCRCPICTAAKRDAQRAYRAKKNKFDGRGTPSPISALPTVPIVEDAPGPVEQGIIDRCETGDLAIAAQRMPDLYAACRVLARIMDKSSTANPIPRSNSELRRNVQILEERSAFSRRGRLASVAALSQRRPSSGVG